MTEKELQKLKELALKVREHIIRMSTHGGCFIGASLSCADILVFLYQRILNVNPNNLQDPKRDYVLLSKGHDVPALYGVLTELGFFEKERLKNHLFPTDSIYWHPNRKVPGIEFHSGSLGHLLSVGIGIALDINMRKYENKVYVILGDGELNEGSIWEAALVAGNKQLDNLIAIVDRNYFQANIQTEKLMPLEPIENKFAAFGWNTFRTNGHDFEALEATCALLKKNKKPTVIIADTVRGKGLPSIEEKADRWFVNFTEKEADDLLNELHGNSSATLTSETLMVR